MGEDDDLAGIPKPGDLIAGKLEVERVLGVGGMGVVVAARHVHLGQKVAVKFLRAGAAKHKEAVGRFLREARSAVGLQSAHVVRVTDVGTLDGGLPYMVMEHLSGEDLSDMIKARRALGVEEACDYVLQACEAIAEAHAAGIVHRDLKPSNLFLTRKPDGSPFVKVLDFGISKAVDPTAQDQSLTATSSVMGSPLYMSPEQMAASRDVDPRSDIWAIGAVIYQLLTCSAPFVADTMPELCAKIVADAPAGLRERRPDLPLAFEAVVMRCLEKDVARRYQSVGDLAVALRDFASIEGRMSADRAARIGAPRAPMASGAAFTPAGVGYTPPSAGFTPSVGTAPAPSSPHVVAGERSGDTSGQTGYADTVGTWQTGNERKRRTAVLAAVAVVCALGAIGVGAFVALTRDTSHATSAPVPEAPAPTPTVTPAASSIAPLPPLEPAPSAVASAAPSASAKRPQPGAIRPVGSGVAQPPRPPPPQPGGDLLLDRK